MHQLTFIVQQALFLVLVASGPPVIMSLVIGFMVSVFQATTQIQEQTLSFVPKMIAVFAILAATGPWIGATMIRFAQLCLGSIPEVIH